MFLLEASQLNLKKLLQQSFEEKQHNYHQANTHSQCAD